MSGMYFYAYALAQIPVGIMLDRIGIRKTLTMLGVMACVGDLIFSLSPSILTLTLGRGLIGFGVGGFITPRTNLPVNYEYFLARAISPLTTSASLKRPFTPTHHQ